MPYQMQQMSRILNCHMLPLNHHTTSAMAHYFELSSITFSDQFLQTLASRSQAQAFPTLPFNAR